jgi:predicted PurR-regulated permease PerM
MSIEPMDLGRELEVKPVEDRTTIPAAGPSPARSPVSSQVLVTIFVVLAACYFAEMVFVVILVSILLAFIVAPMVDFLERFRLSRPLAALIVMLTLLAIIYGLTYYSFSKATDFIDDLPKYSSRIRHTLARFKQKAEDLQKSTQNVLPPSTDQRNTVRIQQESTWSDWLTKGAGSVTEVILALGFIPFLVYFMLSWQEHVRASTVMLFRMENRNTAYVTLGAISRMIRSFIVGNVLVGLFMAFVASLVFWIIGLPYFYFVGLISGFLSLVPYLGVLLALVPPLVAGLENIHTQDVVIIVLTVFGLHIFSLNVLYPKIVGKRVQLNPLAVTVALLVWGWLWGAMGLILAIPITAAMKIIFDHVESLRGYGAWLGE